MNTGEIRAKLSAALIRYDRTEAEKASANKRHYHNHNALALYLARLDDIISDIENGASAKDAIEAGFSGKLVKVCLAAIGEKPGRASDRGALTYVPASERKRR